MNRREFLGVVAGASVAGLVAPAAIASAEAEVSDRLGPFLLVNPPTGAREVVEAAFGAMLFPWSLLDEVVKENGPIRVEWDDTGQGVSGRFLRYSWTIVLSNRSVHLDDGAAFVFAHEVGHLIDAAILDETAKRRIMASMHETPYVQLGHFDHDHEDAGHDLELWANGSDAYVSRIYECFADQWVAAFAPKIWSGEVLPGAYQRFPRFVHWTEDHALIRSAVLEAGFARTPEPEPEPEPTERARPRRHRHPRLTSALRRRRRRIVRLRRRVRRLRRLVRRLR